MSQLPLKPISFHLFMLLWSWSHAISSWSVNGVGIGGYIPDKSRDENCRIFLPVENNIFVLLATFITSYTKLPSSWQIISQQFFRCNRGSVSLQVLLLSIFFIVFFSANSNDIFENSQNLVSIDQTTCGLFIYFNFIFSRINKIKIYKNEK